MYRPLPDGLTIKNSPIEGLTIKNSPIEGLGLFTNIENDGENILQKKIHLLVLLILEMNNLKISILEHL